MTTSNAAISMSTPAASPLSEKVRLDLERILTAILDRRLVRGVDKVKEADSVELGYCFSTLNPGGEIAGRQSMRSLFSRGRQYCAIDAAAFETLCDEPASTVSFLHELGILLVPPGSDDLDDPVHAIYDDVERVFRRYYVIVQSRLWALAGDLLMVSPETASLRLFSAMASDPEGGADPSTKAHPLSLSEGVHGDLARLRKALRALPALGDETPHRVVLGFPLPWAQGLRFGMGNPARRKGPGPEFVAMATTAFDCLCDQPSLTKAVLEEAGVIFDSTSSHLTMYRYRDSNDVVVAGRRFALTYHLIDPIQFSKLMARLGMPDSDPGFAA